MPQMFPQSFFLLYVMFAIMLLSVMINLYVDFKKVDFKGTLKEEINMNNKMNIKW
uniref:ATP synthase F0 subunit 8 n=1 Tax=Menacanthus cornutus TaxID=1491751 RepID=UPI0020008E63|nr:ATP synthase F0 subunit 8 [Menacanthus cornutus]UNZ12996.1 ATP synthase F0 subunit 8 [Menacanthus cornutus]